MTFQQIWHGDSRELGQKFKWIDCIITDPPFGVDNLSNMARTRDGARNAKKILNDESPEHALKIFDEVMATLLPRLRDNSDVYIFTSYQVLSEWLAFCDTLFGSHGLKRSAVLIWDKDGPGMGNLDSPWGMGVEFILYYRKGNRPKSATRRGPVIQAPQIRPNKLIHPHEKPLSILEPLISASTNPGDFIVDPFGGSGSLAMACRELDRNCVCIELDPDHYLESTKRLESTPVPLHLQ